MDPRVGFFAAETNPDARQQHKHKGSPERRQHLGAQPGDGAQYETPPNTGQSDG